MIFLTHKISQGKNWARVVIALLVVASILGEFCPGGVIAIDPSLERVRKAFTIAGYVFLIVEIVAIVLLFLGDSNRVFRTKKQARIQDNQEIDAEQDEPTTTEGVLGAIIGAAEQRKAATIGGILGAILGAIVYMVVVYITLGDTEEFNAFFMLFLGFIGLVTGLVYSWGFSLLFAKRFSTAISVIAGLTITLLLVPVSSFCCLMFSLA